MIERTAKEAFVRLASQFPVVAITGPRQSGKTTLARTVFPDKQYVSFDDRYYRELARNAPKDFLLAFPDGVIIDEAQKEPAIFDALKLFVDKNPYEAGRYIVTGSSQLVLKNMADSLAGRIAFLRLLPFSIG
jgi:predicted AAA+ superfamily ATPase